MNDIYINLLGILFQIIEGALSNKVFQLSTLDAKMCLCTAECLQKWVTDEHNKEAFISLANKLVLSIKGVILDSPYSKAKRENVDSIIEVCNLFWA